jgi:hypothetical protein
MRSRHCATASLSLGSGLNSLLGGAGLSPSRPLPQGRPVDALCRCRSVGEVRLPSPATTALQRIAKTPEKLLQLTGRNRPLQMYCSAIASYCEPLNEPVVPAVVRSVVEV